MGIFNRRICTLRTDREQQERVFRKYFNCQLIELILQKMRRTYEKY